MSFNMRSTVSGMWMLAIVVTGFVASIDSLMGWLTMSVVAFGPSIMLLHFMRDVPTTAQVIQEARR